MTFTKNENKSTQGEDNWSPSNQKKKKRKEWRIIESTGKRALKWQYINLYQLSP